MATTNALNNNLSGQTGTGSVVGSDAPTIINGIWQNPSIRSAAGTVLTVSSTGIPVNQFVMTASPTTVAPFLSVSGTDTNITMQLNGKGTGGATLQGITSGSFASTGYVGEYRITTLVSAAAYPGTGTRFNQTSVALSAGNWVVNFQVVLAPTNTGGLFQGGLSTTTADASISGFGIGQYYQNAIAGNVAVSYSGSKAFSLSSSGTVYLVGIGVYAGGAPNYYCQLYAVRI